MKLYEVVKYGTNSFPPGDEGTDTLYLVRAATLQEAVSLVLPKLRVLSEEFVAPTADVVHVVGEDLSREGKAMVLRGPWFQRSSNHGWDSWRRSEDGNHWEARPFAKNGIAEAWHDNGEKAAEMHYRDGQEHGWTTRWYDNGRMMFRGRFDRGRRVGLHELWYPDGAKQQDLEFGRSGVRVARWLEDGTLLEEYTEVWDHLKG